MEQDTDCYRRFLQGDEAGLVQIIEIYKDSLILYLNGFVSDLAVAEDLAEDTFLKLVLKKPRFSARSSFKTWLYTVGRNVALDYLRRHKTPPSPTTAFLPFLPRRPIWSCATYGRKKCAPSMLP